PLFVDVAHAPQLWHSGVVDVSAFASSSSRQTFVEQHADEHGKEAQHYSSSFSATFAEQDSESDDGDDAEETRCAGDVIERSSDCVPFAGTLSNRSDSDASDVASAQHLAAETDENIAGLLINMRKQTHHRKSRSGRLLQCDNQGGQDDSEEERPDEEAEPT